jgi:hypothetical protein
MKHILPILSLLLLHVGCTQRQLVYVQGGSLPEPGIQSARSSYVLDRDERVNLLLSGHYVEDGENLVLLIRTFDPGSIVAIDDETFEKLTIEIEKDSIHVGEPITLRSSGARFFYSRGVSGYIYRAHGVYSTDGSGTIEILDANNDSMTVDIDMTINVKPARKSVALEEGVVRKSAKLTFKRISVDELTPWLGMPNQEYAKEVYP